MKLGQFITQIRGVSYKPSDVTTNENGLPILRANNINNDEMNFEDLIYINPLKIKENQLLKPGDIFVCASSGSKSLVGKACPYKRYDSNIAFGAFCKVIRINDLNDINADFIRLFFRSNFYREQISELSMGANINNIKSEDIDNLNINIPSIETQNEAVFILNNLIGALNNKKKEFLLFDEMIKSRFIEQFSKYSKIELYKVAKIVMGQSPDSASYNDEGNGLPFFQGKADYGDKFTVVNHFTTKPTKIAEQYSVLMSVRAPVGPVNIANVRCCIGRGLCSIDALEGITNNEFLYNALNAMQNEISSKGTGSTFNAINKNDVYNLMVPNAPIGEQNLFSEFAQLIDNSKFIVQQQIKELQELLDSKMDEYFR